MKIETLLKGINDSDDETIVASYVDGMFSVVIDVKRGIFNLPTSLKSLMKTGKYGLYVNQEGNFVIEPIEPIMGLKLPNGAVGSYQSRLSTFSDIVEDVYYPLKIGKKYYRKTKSDIISVYREYNRLYPKGMKYFSHRGSASSITKLYLVFDMSAYRWSEVTYYFD